MTYKATRNVTSSPGLADGAKRSGSPVGRQLSLFGLEAAPVSRSVRLVRAKGSKTKGTFGPLCSPSLKSAALTLCLASKLMTRLNTDGSTIYAMTWRERITPAGRRFFQLAASARQRNDSGLSGWQSPRARGDAGGSRWKRGQAKNLEDQARMFGLMRGLTVEEVSRLSLSPNFCRRLMGYRAEWDVCADMETPSCQPSPPSSSAPS